MRYFTFRKAAEKAKQLGQKVRFTAGRGYWLFGKPKVTPHPKPKPTLAFTMYDSVTLSEIPSSATAVAGYVNGMWPTFDRLAASFPHAKRLSIAANTGHDAMCLDVETGDATPAEAPAWVKRQHARGVKQPVVYTFLAQAQQLVDALAAAGIKRSQYKLWIAHWTYVPHICTPRCGYGLRVNADATQYSNKALGRNLDASKCSPNFL